MWLCYAFLFATSPPERDWFALREVAKSFVGGDWTSLYSDRGQPRERISSVTRRLCSTSLLRWPCFRPWPRTRWSVLTQFVAAGSALVLLFKIRKPAELRLNVVGVLGSAAMCHVIVSGSRTAQSSPSVIAAAAAACLASGCNALAGACIGLLVVSPTGCLFSELEPLARGTARRGGHRPHGGALGAQHVSDGRRLAWFFGMTSRAVILELVYSAYKEITLLALLKSVLGWPFLTTILWSLSLAVLWLAIVVADARPLGRSIALMTLLAVHGNPSRELL